jgi:hypothetical protein
MYPGHAMTTTLWASSRDDPPGRFRFQVTDDQGVTVITDGLAEAGPQADNEEAQ